MSRLAGYWLVLSAGGVAGIVAGGTYLRTRKAGLQRSDWHPFNWKYPSTEKDWHRELLQHKDSKKGRAHLSMDQFKEMYLLDWTHRSASVAAGATLSLPVLLFLWGGYIHPRGVRPLRWAFGITALQVCYSFAAPITVPENNSNVRLAVHQGCALSVYSLLVWSGLTHFRPDTTAVVKTVARLDHFHVLKRHYAAALAYIAGTIVTGALMAGKDGQRLTNWPWYGDSYLFPVEGLTEQPITKNVYASKRVSQFCHQTLSYCAAVAVWRVWSAAKERQIGTRTAGVALALTAAQILLGIVALKKEAELEFSLAHSGLNLALLTCLLVGYHSARIPLNIASLI